MPTPHLQVVDSGPVVEPREPVVEQKAASFEHDVQFYDSEAFLFETVARFIGTGLASSEPAIVIATAAHREGLLGELQARGFDTRRAIDGGKLTVLDASATLARFMGPDGPDPIRFDAVIGATVRSLSGPSRTRVRAYGEMVDVLWREGHPAWAIELEQLWNDLGSRQPITLLCGYAMANFHREAQGEQFRQVCDQHGRATPTEAFAGGDDARLREVCVLQQRARALESEVEHARHLEAALRRARTDAEAASRAKDEFLAMLGHELRNPLAPIATALQLMKLRGDGRTTREQEIIERQTQHLIRLVDDLLDVSRITRGKVELRREAVDLRDVIARATEIASPLLEERRHHFEVRALPRRLAVAADPARLAQVIANLLTNAARYTEPGGHIEIWARRDGDDAVIEVRDDGIGIDEQLLPRIFDLFVQGRQSADRANGGLGIGLALVRNLVTLHGGTVSASSAGPGRGSTFTVRLQALDEAGTATPDRALARVVSAGQEGRRVLLVDDNEDALEMLQEMLSAAGHDVRTARSGPDALSLVEDFVPEIAILDIGLPAMDGYELAMRLRERLGQRTPQMVALTGYGQPEDRDRSERAGFALHLVKPFDGAELLRIIERPPVRARG